MRRSPHWGMVCCLTLEWLALSLWIGGMAVLIGAVIPAVFNTFGGQDSGGLFLTRAFEGYQRFVTGAVAVLWPLSQVLYYATGGRLVWAPSFEIIAQRRGRG